MVTNDGNAILREIDIAHPAAKVCQIMLAAQPGASGRVLPPVTGRSWVRVAVSSHCTGEGKVCH